MLDFSGCLGYEVSNETLLWTLTQALQISGAKLLELDGHELGSLVTPAGLQGQGLGAVLYDNVPGEGGHMREWLEEAYKTLYVNQQHNDTCGTACLDCLLTFDAQESMRPGLLNRRNAIQVLGGLLGYNDLLLAPVLDSPQEQANNLAVTTTSSLRRTNGERLQRIRQRKAVQ